MADKKNGTQQAGPAAANTTTAASVAGRKRKKLTKVEAVGRAMARAGCSRPLRVAG